MSAPVYNPGEPYLMPIPGGFSPGRIAHVTGTFKPNGTSFILKFQSGPSGDPADEIGLCIYGRLLEGMIGRNAFTRAAGWGVEEASGSVALAQGQNFEVTILCDPMCFKIAVNQQHLAEFSHRTNPATMTYLNVASSSQDITLACVWIEDPAPPPPAQPPYGAPSPAGPYAPQPNYGPPPPYSGGPGYAPPMYPNQPYQQQAAPPGQYGPPQGSGSSGSKGLLGMAAGAGTALAGALGASHLLGKSKMGGYPGGGYPGGGYPGHGGSHGGGILNKALGVGGALAGAKMLSKPSKAMKYGVPLAGMGALAGGGYMMHKGFHHGSSSSSSGSSEEE
ncbi:galectin-4-like [Penaeus japonicus]|uniref:galectin-4-like n=1 Tax=Penaeus japonicus TaxID=27405 RepID=UPI001C714A0C|nr:galectin-4-like [Penaeus japonicus]XP_042891814.1 galectin-4-like [Penaeus japonicus]